MLMERLWVIFAVIEAILIGTSARPNESVNNQRKIRCINDTKVIGFNNVPDQEWQVFPCEDNGVFYCLEVSLSHDEEIFCKDVCCGKFFKSTKNQKKEMKWRYNSKNEKPYEDATPWKIGVYVLLGILIMIIAVVGFIAIIRIFNRNQTSFVPIQETGHTEQVQETNV